MTVTLSWFWFSTRSFTPVRNDCALPTTALMICKIAFAFGISALGHKQTYHGCRAEVRSTSESGHRRPMLPRLLRANRRRSCVSFVGREQAFHQPRAAPELKWPIFETCPGNCGFVRVAQKRAGALKMPVRSHEEHAIVCQRQGVTLVLAAPMKATRLQRPLADEHADEGRHQKGASKCTRSCGPVSACRAFLNMAPRIAPGRSDLAFPSYALRFLEKAFHCPDFSVDPCDHQP